MRISDWSSDVCSSDLGCAFQWRQTLHREHQRDGDVVGDRLVRIAGPHQRVWQPWADIGFATRACGFQAVEAQARDVARQIGGRRIDPAIDLFPSKPSILHHIFSLAELAEHSIGQAPEPLTLALELTEPRSLSDPRPNLERTSCLDNA